jgi:hypothetical protein
MRTHRAQGNPTLSPPRLDRAQTQRPNLCERNARCDPEEDQRLGDSDGLFLRVRPTATKTRMIEHELNGHRKHTIDTRHIPVRSA